MKNVMNRNRIVICYSNPALTASLKSESHPPSQVVFC